MADPDQPPSARSLAGAQPTDRPPSSPAWLTLEEAAQMLETTREGVRSRAKRGTLQSLRGNDGILRVLVDLEGVHRRPPGRPPADRPTDLGAQGIDQVATLQAEVARLHAERDGFAARLQDRDAELERLRHDHQGEVSRLRADHATALDQARTEAERLRADHQTELGRLQQIIDRLTAPRWRRWFRG